MLTVEQAIRYNNNNKNAHALQFILHSAIDVWITHKTVLPHVTTKMQGNLTNIKDNYQKHERRGSRIRNHHLMEMKFCNRTTRNTDRQVYAQQSQETQKE